MREETKHVREGLERIYQAPYLETREAPAARPLVDELSLDKDDVVLELGVGAGHFTLPVARRLEALRGLGVIFACDFSKALVEQLEGEAVAEGLARRVRAICLDDIAAKKLPFSDGRVETVLAVNTLQYLPDPIPYIEEIARVLVPFGTLLIADWQEPSALSAGVKPPRAGGPDDLYTMLSTAGLETVFRLELKGYTWVIRATKPIVVTL
jgi:SAM-dependent methyltransferase